MPAIHPANSDHDIRRCWPVLRQLRPHLDESDLVAAVRRMEAHGFRLIFAEDDAGEIRAVAGYRITELLRTGLMLEVDDLVTDASARSGGYGKALMDWLVDESHALGCSVIELDSGVQRHAAHRFYFREGMHILGYHFSRSLQGAR